MPLTWTTSCELIPSTSLGFVSLFSRATLESRDSWLRGDIPLFLESGKRQYPLHVRGQEQRSAGESGCPLTPTS